MPQVINKKKKQETPKEKHPKITMALKPHPVQQEIMDYLDGKDGCRNCNDEPYRFFAAAIGRRWGKSFLAKMIVAEYAINRGIGIMWVAPTVDTARPHWENIVRLVKKSGIPVERFSRSEKAIYFYGGGFIRIRSAESADGLRGDGLGLIILDEAAFFPEGNYLWWSVIQPMIVEGGGKVLFTTTPNGQNWFYEIYKFGLNPNEEYYKSWNLPSESSPYPDKKLLKAIKEKMPSVQWRTEYMAEFLVDGGGVFSGVELAATETFLTSPLPSHEYVAGVDFGFVNDETVFTVLDKNTRRQVFGEAWTGVGTLDSLRRIKKLMEHWRPTLTVFEKNGLGQVFFDLIKQVLSGLDVDEMLLRLIHDVDEFDEMEETKKDFSAGGFKLRGLHVDNNMKRLLVDTLSADIEYARLPIITPEHPYGAKQVAQMSTFERKRTASGLNVTYAAQQGEHDDYVSALYLARHALPRPTKIIQETEDTHNKSKRTNPLRSRGRTSNRWHRRR